MRQDRSRPRITRHLLPAFCAGYAAAHAQVLVSPVEISEPTPSVETAAQNLVGSVSMPVLRSPSLPGVYPLQWGPVQFHPYLSYQLSYGNGLLQGPFASEKTARQSIGPGVYLELGRHWALDAAATLNQYSNPVFQDNSGYSIGVRGSIPREEWLLNFGFSSSLTEELQVETATQEVLNTYGLSAAAIRSLPGRLALELGVSQDIHLSETQNDYVTWATRDWLNYKATPKTSLGLGVGGGYNLVESAPNAITASSDWTFEELRARVIWQPGKKLDFQVGGGYQFVQFQGTNSTSDVFPLVDASVVYQILSTTTLSASAGHGIENSLLADQFTEFSNVRFGLRQRFLEHFYLDLSPGYSRRTYDNISDPNGGTGTREDNEFSFHAQFSTVLFRRLNSALFYRFSDNDSSTPGFSFKSNELGLRVAYRY